MFPSEVLQFPCRPQRLGQGRPDVPDDEMDLQVLPLLEFLLKHSELLVAQRFLQQWPERIVQHVLKPHERFGMQTQPGSRLQGQLADELANPLALFRSAAVAVPRSGDAGQRLASIAV